MSAIWGMIRFNGESISEAEKENMVAPYKDCKIDRYSEIQESNLYFGCGLQYITKEARYEQLPKEEQGELFFTADVYLDNREELLSQLQITEQNAERMADGALVLEAYKKWKLKCVDYLLGAYTFVIYDKKSEEIICVRDAVGSRCFYYCEEKGAFYFSTLLQPILQVKKTKVEWNKRWLSDYLAIFGLANTSECEETPYQGIYKVAPAQIVRFSKKNGIQKQNYWEPMKNLKELRWHSDTEYAEEFYRIFQEAVKATLRADGKTGVLLSGGLDSTAVACLAAPILKEQDKTLYSFTSVPNESYISKRHPYYKVNEKKSVEATKEYLGNLQCYYCDLPGQNCWDDFEAITKILEVPYKALQNMSWINEALKQGAHKGCKVMLNGQYGNTTISYGDFCVHFQTLLHQGRWITLYKEVNAANQKLHFSRKAVWKDILKSLVPERLRLFQHRKEDMFQEEYCNRKMIERFHTKERFIEKELNITIPQYYDIKRYRPYMAYKEAMSQIGEMETKLSLVNGILIRDPSRDKRMIEFCLRLPEEQFVRNGIERRLIRVYMEQYMPKEILQDCLHKGLQSADWIWRLQEDWKRIWKEIHLYLEEETGMEYFEEEKIKKAYEAFKEIGDEQETDLRCFLYSVLLKRYIQETEEKIKI